MEVRCKGQLIRENGVSFKWSLWQREMSVFHEAIENEPVEKLVKGQAIKMILASHFYQKHESEEQRTHF